MGDYDRNYWGRCEGKITRHGKLKISAEDQDVGEPGQISDRCERGRMKYGKAAGRSGRKVYGCKRMGAETLVAFRQIQDPQQGSLWDPFCGGIKKKNSVRSFFIFLSFLSPHGESRRGGLKSVPCEGRIKTGAVPVSD